MKIRTVVPDDAPALVELRRVVFPYLVRGVAVTRQAIVEPDPAEQSAGFVAEDGGRVVGHASGRRITTTSEADVGDLAVHVHPDRRRRGLGDALFAAARDHLIRIGVRRARAMAVPDALGFARRHAFQPGREVRYSVLDLRSGWWPAPDEPAGIRLLPASELDGRAFHRAYVAAAADEPGDIAADALSYDTWRYDIWDDPGLDRDVSSVAVAGRDILAFSLVQRDGERMWSDMTATVPQHRNGGLARLVKQVALHRAAASGVTVAYTANDVSNVPMLAVNARLGYRRVGSQFACLGDLRPSRSAGA